MGKKTGAEIALQAQLDAVADAIGRDRMRAADGYHGTAVLKFVREWNATRQECEGAKKACADMRDSLAERDAEIDKLRRLLIRARDSLETEGLEQTADEIRKESIK